ncbi:MAG: RNA polymerase sigma-70 factor [Pseudolysinimonas sp.]
MNEAATLEIFEAQRGRLFGIAYRMLGTASDAEDVVQDAWLRWQGTDRSVVREPAAFLATTVTRLAINALDSARSRREVYVGPWLPEPVPTADDPALGAERKEALSLAVLLLLERLTPAERAAFVLHEAFAYPFRQIAEVLEISEANARQLAARARAHLDREQAVPTSAAEQHRLMAAFIEAARNGDLEALEAVLSEDVVALSDGGGIVLAARKPVVGRARVAHFLLGVLEKFASDIDIRTLEVNGESAFVGLRDGVPMAVWTVEIGRDGIRRFINVMNPQKLSRIAAASGLS